MKKHLPRILLVLILALGFGLRFYQLGKAPAGLYIDEAGQGYSAYSILKTGKDEFGKSFPIVFRGFTDFKTPVYIYSIVPLIPIFGLSTFTVRLPSLIFSVLTLPLLYLLILRLTSDRKLGLSLALAATLLLAISPWHILFGRTDYECTIALFLFLLGIYLFYLSLKRPFLIIASLISFAVAIPAYHAERVLVPLTIAILFYRFRKTVFSQIFRRYLIAGFLIAAIITLPTLSVVSTPGFLARLSGLNIISHKRQLPSGSLDNYDGPAASIINSSVFLTTQEFLALYSSYFSPRNMFNLGDYETRSSYPNLSTFFVWQLPFYLLGLYVLIKRKEWVELRFVMILLLLITPIPAAITRDPYSTIRALPLVIPQITVIGIGIITCFLFLGKIFKPLAIAALTLLIFHSVLNLYSSGIVLNEYHRPREWNYGLEQVANFINTADPNLPVVVDSKEENYIQLAFFLKADPVAFQRDNYEVSDREYYTNMSRLPVRRIGKVTVKPLKWEEDLKIDQYLVADNIGISDNQIKEHNLIVVKEILYPDQGIAYRIVRTNPNFENFQTTLR
jgi:4-amino-4-deoxy-L-arabinose transferase-like glycosyltransferase